MTKSHIAQHFLEQFQWRMNLNLDLQK